MKNHHLSPLLRLAPVAHLISAPSLGSKPFFLDWEDAANTGAANRLARAAMGLISWHVEASKQRVLDDVDMP